MQVSLKASNFTNNAAELDFGAIGLRGSSPINISLQGNNCNFSNNSAGLAGALYATASQVSLTNCHFNNNCAATGTGGAYLDSVVGVQLEGSTFTSNTGGQV